VEQALPQEFTNSIGMKLCLIPAGEVSTRVSNRGDSVGATKGAVHRAFYMGGHEVTVGQFRHFVSETQHLTTAEREGGADARCVPGGTIPNEHGISWHSPGFEQTDRHPVTCVSWEDAMFFCQWLSEQEGKSYRLPTCAEWEYACRAGSKTKYVWGDELSDGEGYLNVADLSAGQDGIGWTDAFAFDDGFVATSPVGHYRTHGFGLADIEGNVSELCSDLNVDTSSPASVPAGTTTGFEKIGTRGCSWALGPHIYNPDKSFTITPAHRTNDNGFRVVIVLSEN
jgi:formylglycine-generating enzyme required for sulfatase activity